MGEIILSNMTLTLANSFVTQSVGMLHDILVHVDGLVFHVDFVVLDAKGSSGGSVILGQPFLETGEAKIDVETSELILKVNKKKVVFKVFDWEPCEEKFETFYHLEARGSKRDT